MLEDYKESILLTLRTWSSRKSLRMLVESWKFRCQQQCFVKPHCAEVAGKPAAPMEDTRQNTLDNCWSWNLCESEWKELLTDIWCANLFLCLKQWKNQRQRQQWKNNGKNSRKYRHGSWRKVIAEARNKGHIVHFASLMDLCHLKNSELEPQFQKYKGRVVLRGDIVKDDSGSCAVFTEQGSSASQMTAAKIMDIISRLPGCDGQAADAVSAYTQVKMEDAYRRYWKFPNRNVQTFRYVHHDMNGPSHGPVWKTQSFLSERNLYGHPLAGLLWERQIEKILLKHGWENSSKLWMFIRTSWKKGLFLSVYVDDIKLAGKKQNLDPMWKSTQ